MLSFAVLCCATLHCVVLCYAVLCCAVLFSVDVESSFVLLCPLVRCLELCVLSLFQAMLYSTVCIVLYGVVLKSSVSKYIVLYRILLNVFCYELL